MNAVTGDKLTTTLYSFPTLKKNEMVMKPITNTINLRCENSGFSLVPAHLGYGLGLLENNHFIGHLKSSASSSTLAVTRTLVRESLC